MSGGIRAEVSVDAPDGCPIAAVSGETGSTSYSVSKSVAPGDDAVMTEEFVLDADVEPTVDDAVEEPEVVFSYGDQQVLRFSRERGTGCPCERIEQFDCPVVDVHTRDGTLYLAFHAPDMERLSDALSSMRERYPQVRVQQLLRSKVDHEDEDIAFVDRSVLTERQREVLETAHEMGYFEHPKDANAGEVAAALDISPSTFSEHLSAAQRKLLESLVES
ncbi:MAG: helix-turn-helix domain-containing protein [Haloferacaceae archaeon]